VVMAATHSSKSSGAQLRRVTSLTPFSVALSPPRSRRWSFAHTTTGPLKVLFHSF
jgi:hypothetical protein